MESIKFSDQLTIKLVDFAGSDLKMARYGKVVPPHVKDEKLSGMRRVRHMLSKRHGTPFEQSYLQFYVRCPIFVLRQWHRHRIGWSYNEESGRYKQLAPLFYIASKKRPIVEVEGYKSYSPAFDYNDDAYLQYVLSTKNACRTAYREYEKMLGKKIGKELCRSVLGTAVYTSMYAACNLRSFLHFLNLRTQHPNANKESHPQWEIEQLALKAEKLVAKKFPSTIALFREYGSETP
jgi:thymidylate synthase (FAD)